jgi:hypothetical protein
MIIAAAIPRLARVKDHEVISRILRTARFIISETITGKKIWTIILPVAGFPVSPIKWIRRLKHK